MHVWNNKQVVGRNDFRRFVKLLDDLEDFGLNSLSDEIRDTHLFHLDLYFVPHETYSFYRYMY